MPLKNAKGRFGVKTGVFLCSLSSVSPVLGAVPSTLSEPRRAQQSETLLC